MPPLVRGQRLLSRRGTRVLSALCVVVALFATPALALDPTLRLTQYVHDAWTTNEGLPQDSINQIVQTPDGYLWMATQEGIARFDGTRFSAFDSRNTRHIEGDFIHTVFVDRAGTLWAGASSGLLRYDGNGVFTKFGEKHGFLGSAAKYISEDANGHLWIGFGNGRPTGGKGLLRFKGAVARVFTTADGLPGNQVYQTWSGGDGALWIGTGDGLAVMRKGAIETFTTADGLPANFVRTVREDRDGVLWAGTPHGLARYDGKQFTTFTTRDGLLADDIESIYEDRDGALWIATSKGLNRIRNGNIEPAGVPGLGEDRVFSILEDREGSLWIGTHASGLHRLRAGKFTPFGPPEGMTGQNVTGIYQDWTGRIWMGTSPGGVNVLDGEVMKTYASGNGLPAANAKSFLQDRNGAMWIGTSEGLVRFENGRFTLFDTRHGLPHRSINVMWEDRNGTLWAGTNGGLARRTGERFETIPLPPTAPVEIRVVREDRQGRLIIGGGDGAGFVDGTRYVPLAAGAFAAVNVMTVHEDDDGTLWFATWGNGLFRLREGILVNYTSAHGLFDNTIWSIVDDRRGQMWMGSNRGIFRVSRQQLDDFARRKIEAITCTVFGSADGMRKRETNSGKPAAIRARDGRLWFATTGGAVVIDPAHIPVNRRAPNVLIERFVANEREIPLRDPIVLKAGSRSLEAHYVALTLITPGRVRYRYRLDGFDDHWIDAGSRRSAYYTNIDPGTYTFRVVAANADGVWSPEGAAITFRLRPYFYQTWWFYVLVVAALVGLAYAMRAARRRQLEIRRRIYHDALTGLPNRVLLTDRAQVALKQAGRRGRSIAILFLDLDGFKGVNDRYGHAAGDQLLQMVADRLRACIREIDTLARIGGDEFAVLVADLEDESRAAEIARRMIDAIRVEFTVAGEVVRLGVSIGIAFHPYDGEDVASILEAADRAMYRAKLAGGNEYQYNVEDRDELVVI